MSEPVRYREHEKIKFVSTSGHEMFCLLYKHTNYDFLYDFPNTSDHFPSISEDSPKVVRRPDVSGRFRTVYYISYYVTMAMVIFSISSHVKDK